MSVRFVSNSDGYLSTTGQPTSPAYTFTFWTYLSVDQNTYTIILQLHDALATTNAMMFGTDADGTTLGLFDRDSATVFASQVAATIGTWYQVGIVVNGGTTTLYTAPAGGSVTTWSGAVTWATTFGNIDISSIGNGLNGRVAAFKMWDAALTSTEVSAELAQFDPLRVSNLLRYHPFHVAEITDYSDNGNTLTAGSTATTTEADPPIAGAFGSNYGTVTHVATSTPAAAGTTTSATTVAITPTLPTGTAAGDRVWVIQAGNSTSGTTPTSWTALSKDVQVGPTGTAPGAGTGRRYLSVYYRDYDGAWSMPAFTLTSAAQNTHALSAITLRKTSTATWDTPTASTAGNTASAATAYSVTTGSVTATSGMVLVGTATNDNVTASLESLTSTAMTFTNLTERSDIGSATGNDVSIKSYTADIFAGGIGTITHAATLSAASEGGSIVVAQSSTAAPALPLRTFAINQSALVRAGSW